MWKITKDLITDEEELKEGKTWEHRKSFDWDEEKASKSELHEFRLLDDDDVVYLEGVSDDDSDFDPLDTFTGYLGVTSIEYKNKTTDEWEIL